MEGGYAVGLWPSRRLGTRQRSLSLSLFSRARNARERAGGRPHHGGGRSPSWGVASVILSNASSTSPR